MSQQQEEGNTLFGKIHQQRLYVVLSTLLKPVSEMVSIWQEHVHYIIDLEKRGLLFASGPFTAENPAMPGSGMIILRVASRAEAEAIVKDDPLSKSGMRTSYEIKEWMLSAGSYHKS